MNNIVVVGKEFGMTEGQMSVITNSIAKGATPDELRLFLYTAKRCGLDPFSKQIYFVKRKTRNADGTYSETGAIQTGIDGYRAIAERAGGLAGIDDVLYDDETKEHPNKATVTVYRIVSGQKVHFAASARWSEYCQINYKTQKPQGLWAKMPYLMLGKCAEALALRKAFPNDLSGIYTSEEMQQADNGGVEKVNKQTGEVIDVDTEETELPKPKKAEPMVTPAQGEEIANLWKNFLDLQKEFPVDQGDAVKTKALLAYYKVDSTTKLTEKQADSFIQKLKEKMDKLLKVVEKGSVVDGESVAEPEGKLVGRTVFNPPLTLKDGESVNLEVEINTDRSNNYKDPKKVRAMIDGLKTVREIGSLLEELKLVYDDGEITKTVYEELYDWGLAAMDIVNNKLSKQTASSKK